MLFAYGQGEYREGNKVLKGKIVLSEHKLFLQDASGDLAQTYIPLEKIERIKKTLSGLEVHVQTSLTMHYVALLQGERKNIVELIKDLVQRRGFKKQFLRKEWVDTTFYDS